LALILAPFGLADFGLRLFGYSLELLLFISHFFAQFAWQTGYSSRARPASSVVLSALALGALISTTGAARYILGNVLAMASIGIWLNAPWFVAH
jgi:competence protein ComEC